MKFLSIIACAGVVVMTGQAAADPGLSGDAFIGSLHKADFIFEGVVTAVDYKSSRPTGASDRPMPHTFVTFDIRKVYKGNPGALRSITLRFLGGATGIGRRVLDVSMYPLFDVGDHDILMVERNTKKSCPLTSCAQGRFRIIDELVYSDLGNEIDLTPAGALAYGPQHRLPEIDVDMVAGQRMEKLIRDDDPPGGIALPPRSPPSGWRHMTAGAFATYLEAALEAHLSHGERTRKHPVASARLEDDFVFVLLREGLPDSEPHGLVDNLPVELVTSIQEQLELEMFKANGSDPRL